MSSPITIRNLTAQPLTIKVVERYEAPKPQEDQSQKGGFSVASLTSNFTSLLGANNTDQQPERRRLSVSAQSFAREDVDIRMEPFRTSKTLVKTSVRDADEVLRLTFEGEGGGRWRIDIPLPTAASNKLTPLTPDPKHEYTAIYFPSSSFLAVSESTNLQQWMSHLLDPTPLSSISIPGTHNSPTYYKALPSVRCQYASPVEQLLNGVRFFDIRLHPNNPEDRKDDSLALVHGAFPISLTGPKKFRALYNEVLEFLKNRPTETVIFSIKREGTGDATDAEMAEILKDHYTNPRQWYTEPRVPTLGEVRGRIVLMRRFALSPRLRAEWGGRGWAINAENWDYNTPHCSHGHVCVQDFCEVMETENIDKKIGLCCEHFERAANVCSPVVAATADPKKPVQFPPFYLNFLSASNFWKVGCWPEKIAEKLNPAVTAFLCEKHDIGDKGANAPGEAFAGDGGVGIVVCDWVGKDGNWDLVRCIIGMNARILLREKGIGWR